MDELYKVGIIIPAYNVESYIFRAMDSCIGQTYKNIEIIVVDDGSSDGTYDIVQSYAARDSRIKLHRQENSGVSVARNKALDMCQSDYVLFLDSDDWLEPETVEKLVCRIDPAAPHSALISGALNSVYLDASGIKRTIPRNIPEAVLSAEEALMYTGEKKYHLASSCFKLYSMSVINRNALRFAADIKHGEDGLFVFEYLKNTDRFISFPDPLWNILHRPGSATSAPFSKAKLSAIKAVEKMLSYDNSEALQDELRVFLVRRAQWMLADALMAEPAPREDIRALRKILISNFFIYMRKQKSVKQKLLYIIVTFAPGFITVKLYKSKIGT